MATTSHAHQLVELMLDQDPASWIAERREEGMSFRRIAGELNDATGIDLAPETLRLWTQPDEATA